MNAREYIRVARESVRVLGIASVAFAGLLVVVALDIELPSADCELSDKRADAIRCSTR
jgi:hypothetical protein